MLITVLVGVYTLGFILTLSSFIVAAAQVNNIKLWEMLVGSVIWPLLLILAIVLRITDTQ